MIKMADLPPRLQEILDEARKWRIHRWTRDYALREEQELAKRGLHGFVLHLLDVATDRTEVESFNGAHAVSSEMASLPGYPGGFHRIMLDIDVPAFLLPSSREGHSHLYIDVATPWPQLEALLIALRDVGAVEEGYARLSIERKATFLRAPWVEKGKEDLVDLDVDNPDSLAQFLATVGDEVPTSLPPW